MNIPVDHSNRKFPIHVFYHHIHVYMDGNCTYSKLNEISIQDGMGCSEHLISFFISDVDLQILCFMFCFIH